MEAEIFSETPVIRYQLTRYRNLISSAATVTKSRITTVCTKLSAVTEHRQTDSTELYVQHAVAYPGILFEGGSTNSVEDRGERERGSGGGSPLVTGSGGSCNLVQEILFHIVIFFFNFWYFKTIYEDNQFICHC